MSVEYTLKHKFCDFVVEELSALPDTQEGEHSYCLLEKSGITTFEALDLIAEYFSIDVLSVDAAGLKDEDAITKQVISLKKVAPNAFFIRLASNQWLSLSAPICFSEKPKVKGSLFGNSFWVVIRNLEPEIANKLQETSQPNGYFNHTFVNYFDRQRFGLPGSNYRTAEIGAHLIEHNINRAAQVLYEESMEVLKKNAVLPKYQKKFITLVNEGTSLEEAFQCIHQRIQTFAIASHFSKSWNELVSQKIATIGRNVRLYDQFDHPLHYCLGIVDDQARSELPSAFPLTHANYSEESGTFEMKISYRTTLISAKFFILENKPDTEFPGRNMLKVHFYLPSGCYGTSAIHQMLHGRAGEISVPASNDLSLSLKQA